MCIVATPLMQPSVYRSSWIAAKLIYVAADIVVFELRAEPSEGNFSRHGQRARPHSLNTWN